MTNTSLTLTDTSIERIKSMAEKDGLDDASIRVSVIGEVVPDSVTISHSMTQNGKVIRFWTLENSECMLIR